MSPNTSPSTPDAPATLDETPAETPAETPSDTPAETSATRLEAAPRERKLQPAVDIFERADGFVLLADLPGVAPADLEVEVEQSELRLRGPVATPVHGERIVYERRFRLSDQIDKDSIAANSEDGVLRLTLRKVAPARARKIAVQAS